MGCVARSACFRRRLRVGAPAPRFALAGLAAATLALVTTPAAAQWQAIAHYTIRQGLAQSQVTALLQDARGYLWVGTKGGLSRFDGRRFVTFTRNDGLPDDMVTALATDHRAGLLIGTEDGSVTFNDWTTFTTISPGTDQTAGRVLALAPRSEGEDLLTVTTKGVIVRGTRTTARPLLLMPLRVAGVAAGGELLAAGAGIVACDVDGTVRTLAAPLPGGSSVVAVSAAERGALLALANCDVVQLGEGDRITSLQATGLAGIGAVLEGRGGEVWIGSKQGLHRLAPDGTLTAQSLLSGRRETAVTALAQDLEGNVWVGTSGDGLYEVTPSPFTILGRDSGLADESAWAFLADERGCTWIATESAGVVRWCDGRVVRQLRPGSELRNGRAMCLARGPDGTLWMGTERGLAGLAPSGRIRWWDRSSGLPDDYVMTLAVGGGGVLWIGTRGGLARLANGRLTTWTPTAGLPDSDVRDLALDAAGTLWIATLRGGLVRFDGERFEPAGGSGFPGRRVWCVLLDSRGVLWAGTDAGLWSRRAGGGAARVVTRRDGLPGDNVLSLAEDHAGSLWVGTDRGVALVSAVGVVERTFTSSEGLSASEANEGAARCAADGRVWLGMATGITVVNPKDVTINAVPPRLVIEGMSIDGHSWGPPFPVASGLPAPEPFLNLPVESREVRFDYVGLGLTRPEGLRYRRMLEGYDHAAPPLTDENHVTYRALRPGRYRFVLEARNSDGYWSKRSLAVTFNIPAAWYGRGWVEASAAGLLLLALSIGFSAGARRIHRRQRVLEDVVTQRTTELNQAYRRIAEQNAMLQELSRSDPLTGLRNRRVLAEQLPAEMAVLRREVTRIGSPSLAGYHGAVVYLLDLDGFKAINDELGHDAGDVVLKRVAEVLVAMTREGDLAVRWGGDELLVLARGVDADGARRFARRMLADLAGLRIELASGHLAGVRASIGFVPYPLVTRGFLATDEWPLLVRAADRLMYLAKSRGGSRACGLRTVPRAGPPPVERELLEAAIGDPAHPTPALVVDEIVVG
jgi:diguanylate cyclase (GGDEF)-like protein